MRTPGRSSTSRASAGSPSSRRPGRAPARRRRGRSPRSPRAGAGGSAVPTPTASAGPRAVNPGRGDPDLLDREVPPTTRPDQNVFDRLNLPVVPTLVVLVLLLLRLVPAATRVVVHRR